MAYNSVDILRDFSANPIPQFLDSTGSTYDPLTGTSLGSGRYGADSLSWGKTSGGLFAPIQVDSSGVVQTANNGAPLTPVVVMQNAANANGNGTTLTTSGYGTAILSIVFSTSPAWSGTVNFEAQGPDGNWYPINGRLRGGSNAPSTTITGGTGLYSLNVRGVQSIRARVSGYVTGSVTVTGQAQATPSSDADEIANVSLTGSNIPNSQPVPIKRTGFSINETDQSVVLNVASGANNTTLITPPVGQIWRVKTLYVNVPSTTGGTAGNHTLYVGTGSVNSGKNWSLNVANTYAANIQISYNTPFAQSQFAPNSLEAFRLAISQLVLNNSYPLVIYYNNGTTGGTQSGTMNITVISEAETVA